MLAELKVTIRCIPQPGQAAGATGELPHNTGEPAGARCIFTGKPSHGLAVFAKAY